MLFSATMPAWVKSLTRLGFGAGRAGDAADDAVLGDHAGLGQEPDAQAPEDARAGGPGGRRGERAHQREHPVRALGIWGVGNVSRRQVLVLAPVLVDLVCDAESGRINKRIMCAPCAHACARCPGSICDGRKH